MLNYSTLMYNVPWDGVIKHFFVIFLNGHNVSNQEYFFESNLKKSANLAKFLFSKNRMDLKIITDVFGPFVP